MSRTRYRFGESRRPHFLTCTVVAWLPVFTRPEAVEIVLDSWRFLQPEGAKTLLDQLEHYKLRHKIDQRYQLWQEGSQPKESRMTICCGKGWSTCITTPSGGDTWMIRYTGGIRVRETMTSSPASSRFAPIGSRSRARGGSLKQVRSQGGPWKRVVQAIAIVAILASHASAQPLRVDLNPDNGRGDVRSPHAENWPITEGAELSRKFGAVEVTFRAPGGRLASTWWKAGYDSGAVLASDGLTRAGGTIEMVIRGLSPGRHSLATWHNCVEGAPLGAIGVSVDGTSRLKGIKPTSRVAHDDDAASAWVEFAATAGKEVVIAFTPDGEKSTGSVVINGFALDVPDPSRQAKKPQPAHGDEHAAETPLLSWTPPADAAKCYFYLGTSREAVAAATPRSPEYQGEPTDPRWATRGLNPFATHYWRVDAVSANGEVTPSPVWRFKVRRLAFPGAEGYGRFAAGGRGGRVIEVTNLDDSGPGSLRAAVEAEGPRTVVFRVGGTIKLASKLVVRNPYLTVAGQTAPGDGICIRGYTFGCLGTHDVILRYVRIRVGDEARLTMDGTGFASTDHAIFDHCSISWSIDEAVSSRGAGNITLQRCLVAEALNIANHAKYEPGKGHSFAASIGGNVGSFHHNLLAHCAGRNWSLAGALDRGNHFAGFLDIRNNVVFNWQHRTTDGGAKAVNFVNNFYIPGPATRIFHLVKPDAGKPGDRQQYFIAGNVMEGRPQYDADNWSTGGVVVDAGLLREIKLAAPFCEPHVATHSAREAYESVLADVGANFPRLDAIDQRIIEDVKGRKATATGSKGRVSGIIDTQADVGGWPELKGGTPPLDSDHDGLPDDWELARGLDPRDPADGNRIGDGGYTQLEIYQSGLVAR